MKVVVAGEIVAAVAETENAHKLHQLLLHARDGRHALLFDPPGSIEGWLQRVDAGTRSAYSAALLLSTRQASALPADVACVRVCNVAEAQWSDPIASVGLDDALALLSLPLGIMLENSINDWHFLSGLMRPSEREIVARATARGWAEILHGGGATLVPQIQARTAKPHVALRTFALFDSDRRHPDELDPGWSPTGQESCTGFHIEQLARTQLPRRYWMLRRRHIESYMPRAELEAAVSANVPYGAIDAFFRMPEAARWYYNMKRGFNGDAPVENKHRSRQLYDSVTAEDRALLATGFGRIADRFGQAAQRTFPWDSATRTEAMSALPDLLRLL